MLRCWNTSAVAPGVLFAMAILVAQPAHASDTYRPDEDFSLAANPNGVWSYGRRATVAATDLTLSELTDDFTMIKGDHTITIGTHNEFFQFDNLFIQNGFGAYEFQGIEGWMSGIATRRRLTIPAPGQPPSQQFNVNQIGLYAGDQWLAKPNPKSRAAIQSGAPPAWPRSRRPRRASVASRVKSVSAMLSE